MKPKKILLADDDPALLAALTVRCKSLGVEIRHASQAMQALIAVHQSPPDLVIIDIHMPAGDGLSVCQMMASDQRLRNIPVIVLTGQDHSSLRARANELGAYYVIKSTDCWNQLKPLIHQLLGIPDPEFVDPDFGQQPVPAPKKSSTGKQGPLVMVVDDDQQVTQAIQIRLEAGGFRVVCVNGGSKAFGLAKTHQPDIITMDISMPDMDGISFFQNLKSHPLTQWIPVIVLTGQNDPQLKNDMLAMGAAHFLVKPFSTRELLEKIKQVLEAGTVLPAKPRSK